MTYKPVVPFDGVAGFAFLARTRASQQEALISSNSVQRDITYFRENIGAIVSAADLVADRRLLSVALGAFGLNEDIGNKYFVQKVLEDGTLNEDALANKLSDKRYYAFAKAFGFGDFPVANTQLSDFPDKIIEDYGDIQFEIAIGDQNQDLRLALGLERELGTLIADGGSENKMWFSVMGSSTLRTVFETALNLPASMGSIDLDQQLRVFQQKAEQTFGSDSVAQFSDAETRDKLVDLYLLRSQIKATASSYSPSAVALTLLQS